MGNRPSMTPWWVDCGSQASCHFCWQDKEEEEFPHRWDRHSGAENFFVIRNHRHIGNSWSSIGSSIHPFIFIHSVHSFIPQRLFGMPSLCQWWDKRLICVPLELLFQVNYSCFPICLAFSLKGLCSLLPVFARFKVISITCFLLRMMFAKGF